MELKSAGLEDDFPFSNGRFSGSMLIFRGVYQEKVTRHVAIKLDIFTRNSHQLD